MPLPIGALILTYLISGISLKLADIYGERGKGYIPAIISAITMGILISDSPSSASIILGIILGVAFAGKIDQLNLKIGLGITLATAIIIEFIFGFTIPNLPLLAIVTGGALIDEKGHDRLGSKKITGTFFRFRMTLKTFIIILAFLKGFSPVGIDAVYAVSFLCFDIAYDVIGIIFDSKK